MKKLLMFAGVVVMICSCSSKKSFTTGASRQAVVGMPNPIRESTQAEILELLGIAFAVPESASDIRYAIIANETAQVDFMWRNAKCTCRVQPSSELELKDISGFYYIWKNEADVQVGYNDAKAKWTTDESGESVGICIWWDAAPGIMYSVSMKKNASKENLVELANAVYIQMQGDA